MKDVFGKDCFSDVMEIKSIGANFYLSLSMNIALSGLQTSYKMRLEITAPCLSILSSPSQAMLCPKGGPKVELTQK